MRLKQYLLTILVFTLCLDSGLKAQSKLGFGLPVLNKDTFNIDQTLHLQAYIHNYDTATYNDVISFGLKLNGVQNVNQVIFPNPFYDQVISINPGDSVFANMFITINSAYFEIGPDILVVWPIAHDGAPPYRGIDTIIYVQDKGVGIDEIGDDLGMRVYYNNKEVNLIKSNAEISVNRVRIFDVAGKCLANETTDGAAPLPFDIEAKGIYFVEVSYNKGEIRVYKIVK